MMHEHLRVREQRHLAKEGAFAERRDGLTHRAPRKDVHKAVLDKVPADEGEGEGEGEGVG